MEFKILPFENRYGQLFQKLNMDWLERYFKVEPIDEKVLSEPQAYILEPGGKILFVSYKDHIVGTAALKVEDADTLELTKMAVDPAFQGIGAGKYLCENAIEAARDMGYPRLILYSNTKLKAAIGIYKKLGFQEIPLEPGVYERADIKMEIVF